MGFGAEEGDDLNDDEAAGLPARGEGSGSSAYGEVSRLTFLAPSPKMAGATAIMDINAFIRELTLFPYSTVY